MSNAFEPDGPRWRSGPFVYGAILFSAPLLLLVAWALPTVVPTLVSGNYSHAKALGAMLWGVVVLLCPLAALAYRRRSQLSAQWQRPRRLSILFAFLTYGVSLASYVGVALFVMNRTL